MSGSYAAVSPFPLAAVSGGFARPRSDREQGHRLALVREATNLCQPKPQSVRHARTGRVRPWEALRRLIGASIDAVPVFARPEAGRRWLALLDDLRDDVQRRVNAARAERDYATYDDE